MDESLICLYQGDGPGDVFWRSTHDKFIHPVLQRVTRGLQRVNLGFCGFVCDDPALQPFLPQVIVGSRGRSFRRREMETLLAECPDVWRTLKSQSSRRPYD